MMRLEKTMRCPECDRPQSRWVFYRIRNIGKGYRPIGHCPDCGTEFRLSDAGSYYATGGLGLMAMIFLDVIFREMLPRTVFYVMYFSGVLLLTTFITWWFPYAVRLERVNDRSS